MRALAIGALWLYGAANVVAGAADLAVQHALPVPVAFLLMATGALLIAGGVLSLRGSSHAVSFSAMALGFALVLGVFNERVLGLGHPSHHVVRGAVTAAVMWLVWRADAPRRKPG